MLSPIGFPPRGFPARQSLKLGMLWLDRMPRLERTHISSSSEDHQKLQRKFACSSKVV